MTYGPCSSYQPWFSTISAWLVTGPDCLGKCVLALVGPMLFCSASPDSLTPPSSHHFTVKDLGACTVQYTRLTRTFWALSCQPQPFEARLNLIGDFHSTVGPMESLRANQWHSSSSPAATFSPVRQASNRPAHASSFHFTRRLKYMTRTQYSYSVRSGHCQKHTRRSTH